MAQGMLLCLLLCFAAVAAYTEYDQCQTDAECVKSNGAHYVCRIQALAESSATATGTYGYRLLSTEVISITGSDQNEGTLACIFKPLFPMDSSDILSSVLAAVCTLLASGGGIGGGGLLVPLYINVYKMSSAFAIPLSIATIFGGQLANIAWNGPKKHPTSKRRSLIDWNLALILEPTTLAGTIFGVLMHKVFPVWLVAVLLVLMLGFSTYKTTKKGLKMRKKENETLAAGGSINDSSGKVTVSPDNSNSIDAALIPSSTLERILENEAKGVCAFLVGSHGVR